MWKWLKYRWELHRINREERTLDSKGRKAFKEFEGQKDAAVLVQNWYDSVGWEYDSIQWSRKHLISNALLAKLDRLHLPRPQYSDTAKWEVADEFSPYEGQRVLTREAILEVRTAIRKEERERREVVDFWLKTIGAVLTIGTGLTGALIGLISIWRHRAP